MLWAWCTQVGAVWGSRLLAVAPSAGAAAAPAATSAPTTVITVSAVLDLFMCGAIPREKGR